MVSLGVDDGEVYLGFGWRRGVAVASHKSKVKGSREMRRERWCGARLFFPRPSGLG